MPVTSPRRRRSTSRSSRPADRISHAIFVHERERMRDAERFPTYMLPLNQAGSLLTSMAALGSGRMPSRSQPPRTTTTG
jgi:hypothetical protein